MAHSIQVLALDSFSYSGRLVNSNGSPVTGDVNLRFDLRSTEDSTDILCSKTINEVPLSQGIFNVKLDFLPVDCENNSIQSIMENIPSNHSLTYQVTDLTNSRTYSQQAIYSVPSSFMANFAKSLSSMGATITGQVLKWNAATSKWEAGTVASGSGTVTTINTGSGLSGGPIVNTGTISVAPGGITDGHLASGIAPAKLSGTRDATKYLKGDNTWSSFQADLLATILNGFTSITGQTVSNSDSVLQAFGKLQGQVSTLTTNKLDKTGGTLIVGTIDGVPVPVLPSQIVNKQYVDNLVGGVNGSQWTTDAPHIYYNTGNVGIGTSTPIEKLQVAGNIALNGNIRLKDGGTDYVELKAPAITSGVTFTLPADAGTSGQALTTNGSGILSWQNPSVSSSEIADGSIMNADINASANIDQSKIAGLTTALAGKASDFGTGAAGEYLAGGKVWATLNTDVVPEGLTRLYFTESRVLGTDLAGLTTTAGAVTAADTVLSSIGKLVGNQANHVSKSGDTMAGNLAMGGNIVSGLGTPSAASDAATKAYVDSAAAAASPWTKSGSIVYYNGGNIGIGTSTPQAGLDIATTGTANSAVIVPRDTTANRPATPVNGMIRYNTTTTKLEAYQAGAWVDMIAAATGLDFTQNGNSFGADAVLGTNDNFPLRFETNGTTNMSVLANGNVGIGISAPTKKLHIYNVDENSEARLGDYLYLSGTSGGAPSIGFNGYYDGAAGGVYKYGESSVNRYAAMIEFDPIGGNLSFSNSTTTGNANASVSYSTRLRIASSGNVGIGTTTPRSKFEVVGGIQIGADAATCDATKVGTLRYNATNIEYCNGTSWQAFGVSGSGITSLNGSTSVTQTFAIGTTGTVPAWSTASGAHTLDIPFASASGVTAGLISKADYDNFNSKMGTTLNSGSIFVGNASNVATAVSPSGDVSMTNAGVFSVTKLQGRLVATTAPSLGSFLKWNNTLSNWEPTLFSNCNGVSEVLHYTLLTDTWTCDTISLANATGTLSIANGGTGATTANGALNNLLPSQTGNSGKFLSTNGTTTDWTSTTVTPGGINKNIQFNDNGVLAGTSGAYWDKATGRLGLGADPNSKLWVQTSEISPVRIVNPSLVSGSTIGIILSRLNTVSDSVEMRYRYNSTQANSAFEIAHIGGGQMTMLYGGNVGIGTSTPGYPLEVNGSIKATSFISTSDKRLKKNVVQVEGLDLIRLLRGVRYQWRSNGESDTGFIAQEVEAVLPDAVETDISTGMKAIKYQNIIAPLVESTKELYQMNQEQSGKSGREIATLKRQNRELEMKVKTLELRLERLETFLQKD